jgi:hypothetical protein
MKYVTTVIINLNIAKQLHFYYCVKKTHTQKKGQIRELDDISLIIVM